MKTLLIVAMLLASSSVLAYHPNDVVPESLLYDYTSHDVVRVNNIVRVPERGIIIVGRKDFFEDNKNPHNDIGIPNALYADD